MTNAAIRPEDRVSHAEYVAGCDEDQLHNLIYQAEQKLAAIRAEGWVWLWVVVAHGAVNEAWADDYTKAVEKLAELGRKYAESGQQYELALRHERYRPSEAAELLKGSK